MVLPVNMPDIDDIQFNTTATWDAAQTFPIASTSFVSYGLTGVRFDFFENVNGETTPYTIRYELSMAPFAVSCSSRRKRSESCPY